MKCLHFFGSGPKCCWSTLVPMNWIWHSLCLKNFSILAAVPLALACPAVPVQSSLMLLYWEVSREAIGKLTKWPFVGGFRDNLTHITWHHSSRLCGLHAKYFIWLAEPHLTPCIIPGDSHCYCKQYCQCCHLQLAGGKGGTWTLIS